MPKKFGSLKERQTYNAEMSRRYRNRRRVSPPSSLSGNWSFDRHPSVSPTPLDGVAFCLTVSPASSLPSFLRQPDQNWVSDRQPGVIPTVSPASSRPVERHPSVSPEPFLRHPSVSPEVPRVIPPSSLPPNVSEFERLGSALDTN